MRLFYKRMIVFCIVLGMILSAGFSMAAMSTKMSIPEPQTETSDTHRNRGDEICSLRTKNSKTYRLPDGAFQYVAYAEDIHYVAMDGSLQEINNEITAYTGKEAYAYSNMANAWKTYFADSLQTPNAILMVKDEYSVSFSLPSAAKTSTLKKSQAIQVLSQSRYYTSLREDNRAVIYTDVLPGVDFAYTVKTHLLKEDIILKNAYATNVFTFDIHSDGLSLFEVDGTLAFCDGLGQKIFCLAPLFMEDANGKYSESVAYAVEKTQAGYQLTITADKDFLQAADTQYPVVIDPSIMITGTSTTVDTCVDEQYPASNYHTSENLWTGGKTGTNTMRTYIKFTLPSDIAASNVTAAYLRLKKNGSETPEINANRVTANWTPASVTWNNKPAYTTTGATANCVSDGGAWYKITATAMVKDWLNGTYANYGFLLKEPAESSNTQKTRFYSSEAPSPNKPELMIEYTLATPTPDPTNTPTPEPTSTPAPTDTPSPTAIPEPIWGDADCSGVVTAADAAAVLRYLAGLSELSEQGCLNANVNGDLLVSAADAATILRYLAGLETP